MRLHAAFLIAAIVGFWASAAPVAHAQVIGYGNLTGLPYNYYQSQEQLPYYAKFPPVYYSYPVPRTYGYSPFAYPPGMMTPPLEVAAAPPLDIENPFVTPQPSSTPGMQKAAPASSGADSLTANGFKGSSAAVVKAPRAKTIINPYVSDSIAGQPGGEARLMTKP